MYKPTLALLFLLQPLAVIGQSALEVVPVERLEKSNPDNGVTIQSLRDRQYSAELVFAKHLYQRDKINGDLYSYHSDGLKVYALVNTPRTIKPKNGFPVLIYAHGFHPQPKKYGVTEDGVTSRPGDYYRGIPEHYAAQGYLVVTPDYRGHNQSAGFEFTQRAYLTTSYYAIDVLNLLAAIPELADADLNHIFYAGHSMGGEIGLKVLLATDQIRAASLWSPAVANTYQSILYYGHLYDSNKGVVVDRGKVREYAERMQRSYATLPTGVTPQQVDPINHLHNLTVPLLIQHARGDRSVPYQWAENLVLELNKNDKEFRFYSYDSDNHLFAGANLQLAFERDLTFFSDNSAAEVSDNAQIEEKR